MKRAEQQLRGEEGEDLESGELPDAGHSAGLSRPTHVNTQMCLMASAL